MKFLFVTNPGYGHVHPMVPLAEALAQAGHRIVFASTASFAPYIQSLGFTCKAVGLDWLESETEKTFPDYKEKTFSQLDWFLTEIFANVVPKHMIPDLEALCLQWQPDVVVRNDYDFSTPIVCERLAIPFATVGVELPLPTFVWKSKLGAQLNLLRSQHGLALQANPDLFYRYLYLTYAPPRFLFPGAPRPAVLHHLRPLIFDGPTKVDLSWLADMPFERLVYVTLGTVVNQVPFFFSSVLKCLAERSFNIVMTVGSRLDIDALGILPENVRVASYIPQSQLLPHCDLAITHAGFSTTLAVFKEGIPMIAVPFFATDPLRASLCDRLGTGRHLAFPPPQQWQDSTVLDRFGATLAETTDHLLQSEDASQKARALAVEMSDQPGPEYAVTLLERLARERAPIPFAS